MTIEYEPQERDAADAAQDIIGIKREEQAKLDGSRLAGQAFQGKVLAAYEHINHSN